MGGARRLLRRSRLLLCLRGRGKLGKEASLELEHLVDELEEVGFELVDLVEGAEGLLLIHGHYEAVPAAETPAEPRRDLLSVCAARQPVNRRATARGSRGSSAPSRRSAAHRHLRELPTAENECLRGHAEPARRTRRWAGPSSHHRGARSPSRCGPRLRTWPRRRIRRTTPGEMMGLAEGGLGSWTTSSTDGVPEHRAVHRLFAKRTRRRDVSPLESSQGGRVLVRWNMTLFDSEAGSCSRTLRDCTDGA